MKKTAPSKSLMDFEHNLCILAMIVLFLGGAIFAYKFIKTKNAWQMQSTNALQSIDKQRLAKAEEDDRALALSLQYPTANPLYKQPKELQAYVEALGKQSNRNVIVVDTTKTIWADSNAKAVGQKYAGDAKNEVASTITDGSTRYFVETNQSYPNGIAQTVVPFTDASGKVAGAVILSSSNVMR